MGKSQMRVIHMDRRVCGIAASGNVAFYNDDVEA